MKQQWRLYADKIDTLATRERAMVVIAVLAVVAYIAHMLLVDPLMAKKNALASKMALQQAELQQLRINTKDFADKLAGSDAGNMLRRADIKKQIAGIDESLKDIQTTLVPAQKMKAMLQDVLSRENRLQLVALRTLPVAPLVEKSGQNSAATAKPVEKSVSSEGGVFKHGVQITVQGSYTDMYDYLARLEKLPWRMFWSRASLTASDYPRLTMTVTVYTLSLDQAWLVI